MKQLNLELQPKDKVVCLMSGGLDSTVTMYYARNMGYDVHGLSFSYGQRHMKELRCAKKIARRARIPHLTVRIDFKQWAAHSALTKESVEVPTGGTYEEILASKDIPDTFVPARNIIFTSIAASYAQSIGAKAIFIGANALDYSGYPDCRPEFYEAMNQTLKVGQEHPRMPTPQIVTPIINLRKKEIVELGKRLHVPFELTWSCYQGGKKACGVCDSCVLRLNGFQEAALFDPIEYVTRRAVAKRN